MAPTARMPTDMEFMNRLFHTALRRDLARTLDTLTATEHRSSRQRRALAEHLGLVLELLHHHHTGEDEGLWPLVRRRAPDLGAQLDMLEAEHAAVAGAIKSARAAASGYASDPTSTGDDLRNAVRTLQDTLLPHLDRLRRPRPQPHKDHRSGGSMRPHRDQSNAALPTGHHNPKTPQKRTYFFRSK